MYHINIVKGFDLDFFTQYFDTIVTKHNYFIFIKNKFNHKSNTLSKIRVLNFICT